MTRFTYNNTEIICLNMFNDTMITGVNFNNVVNVDILLENQEIEERIADDIELQGYIYKLLEQEYEETKELFGDKFYDYVKSVNLRPRGRQVYN